MCEDVLEGDEGLSQGVEFVHGGVDAVETRPLIRNLLTVGDGEEEPAVNVKRLPVRRSHRLQRQVETITVTCVVHFYQIIISNIVQSDVMCGDFINLMKPENHHHTDTQ